MTVVHSVVQLDSLRVWDSFNRWFTHFYVWGLFWIISITIVYFFHCVYLHCVRVPILDNIIHLVTGNFLHMKCLLTFSQRHMDVIVVLSMLIVQVIRRLYECLYVTVFSDARIHLVHYILGLCFYPAAALTALLHLNVPSDKGIVEIPFSSLSGP